MAASREDTLLGLLALALIFSGQSKSLDGAVDRLKRAYVD